MTPRPTSIEPSDGLLVAAFGDDAIVYDLITRTAHHVDAVAAWLLSLTEPRTVDELVDEARGDSTLSDEVLFTELERAVVALTSVGLLGRRAPVPSSPDVSGSSEPAGWRRPGRSHAVLDLGVAFRSRDADLLEVVDEFLGTAIDDRPAELFFDLDPDTDGSVLLRTVEEWRFPTPAQFFGQLPGVLNEYASHSRRLAVLHAGAVRTPDGEVIVLPGEGDAGKSTLTAALVQRGCDYLGDEAVGLSPTTGAVVGYPKPLLLDAGSRAALGLVQPDTSRPYVDVGTIRSDVVRLAEAGPVDRVVLPRYRDGGSIEVTRLDRVEAVTALLGSMMNLDRAGEPGLSVICRTASTVPVDRLVHGDAAAAADLLLSGDQPGPA